MKTTEHVLDKIREHAQAVAPHEACGILLARTGIVIDVRLCDNVAPESEREHAFAIDDGRLLETYRLAEQAGCTVHGIYHSHPSTDAEPSGTDKRFAAGDDLWLIYSVRDDQFRAWRMVHDRESTTATEFPVSVMERSEGEHG